MNVFKLSRIVDKFAFWRQFKLVLFTNGRVVVYNLFNPHYNLTPFIKDLYLSLNWNYEKYLYLTWHFAKTNTNLSEVSWDHVLGGLVPLSTNRPNIFWRLEYYLVSNFIEKISQKLQSCSNRKQKLHWQVVVVVPFWEKRIIGWIMANYEKVFTYL